MGQPIQSFDLWVTLLNIFTISNDFGAKARLETFNDFLRAKVAKLCQSHVFQSACQLAAERGMRIKLNSMCSHMMCAITS